MIFDIEAPDGRIFSIEGDSAPTEQELETFFGSLAPATSTESVETSRPDLSNHDFYDAIQSGSDIKEKLSMILGDKMSSFVTGYLGVKKEAEEKAVKGLSKINPIETAKFFARGTGTTISGTGTILKMAGDMTDFLPINPAMMTGINLPKKNFANMLQSIGGLIEKGGDAIESSKILEMDEEYKKEVHSGTFFENPSIARMVDIGMGALPSMAGGYFIGAATKSTRLAALALSFLDASNLYEEARESGKNVGEAVSIFSAGAAGSYLLEKYGLDEFFGETIGRSAKSVLKKMLTEGITEPAQNTWNNLVAKVGYDETRNIWEGFIESMIGGVFGAGVASGFVSRKYNSNIKKLTDMGYSEQQAETIANGVALEMSEHKEVLNKHFEDNIKKFVEQGEAELAQMDENKFYQFKKEAREVEAKILNEMRLDEAGFSDEEIYDMSSIITSQVYAMALMQGTTPANIKLPEIVLEQNAKFLEDLKSKKAKFQFMSVLSKTLNEEMFNKAIEMDAAGKSQRKIWRETGFFKAPDGSWNYEIDSSRMDVISVEDFAEKASRKKFNDGFEGWTIKLGDFIAFDELFAGYDELSNIDVEIYKGDKPVKGSYSDNVIKLNEKMLKDVSEVKKTITHEVQHAIDRIEGLSKGDSFHRLKDLGYDDNTAERLYLRASGEVKARNAEYRMNMPKWARKLFSPIDTQDIKSSEQNIRFQNQRGAYIDGKIYLFEGADVSTVMHEFMHHWQDQMKAMGTKKSQEILAKIDEWSTVELSRKYDVKQVGNKFKIVDKKGNTVYNNLGRNFDTEAEAVAYAKDELFAQGFEQYLSTGKAPNKTLENVFQSFFHYMKKIFAQTKALDIELTPEMKQVYADILGGASIDTFRNKTLEEFIKERADEQVAQREELNRIEESGAPSPVVRFQEDIKDTDVVIKEALDKTKSKDDEKNKKEKSRLLTKMMTSLSTRAKEIHPHLKTILTRYFSDINVKTEDRLKSVKGFLDGMKKIKQTDADDYARMDLAIKNSDIETMIEIAKQYDFVADLNAVREILDEMFVEAETYGLKVDFREDYFPRSVKDYKGLVEYFTGKEFSAVTNSIEKVEKAMGRNMTDTEVANHINMNLRRIANTDLIERTNHRKGRTLDTIDEVVGKYFENSDEALVGYIETMTRHIEAAKILGVNKEQSAESVGNLVNELYKKGEIKRSELDEAQDIIHAALDTSGITYSTLKVIRDTGYLVSMGNFTTAIAQLDDFASTMTHAGFFNAIKALTATGGVDISDIGIRSIGEEFKNPEKLGGLVSGLFKSVGLTKVDNFIKNTFIKGDEIRMKKMSTEALADEIAVLFYDNMEKATQVAKDIQAGKKTEDTLFVYYNNLSKYQPISRFEMPEYYRGNARIFYTLKSFTLKRIDVVLDDIKTILSSEKSTPMQRKAASQHLWKWIFALSACGLSKELLIDLLLGRKIDIDDAVVNTMLGYIGMNRYYLYRAESYGIGDAVNSIVFGFPIINFSNIIQKDFTSLMKGKKDFGELDAWKFVPYIGKIYYERLGGGKDKNKGRGKKGGKKFY